MKHLFIMAALALFIQVAPVSALNVDMSGLMPDLTFPEPTSETVTQDVGVIDGK